MGKNYKSKNKDAITEVLPDPSSGINWFPGHMLKAMKKIKERIKAVDIVLEVRDARSPLITGNIPFMKEIGNKNHLIVLNKANLANPKTNELWDTWFASQPDPYIFIEGFDKKSLTLITDTCRKIIHENTLQSNPGAVAKEKLKLMIIGLPNTGKSTIINRLSNRDASKVADKPGQTQQQLWVKAAADLQILDTPGVLPPTIATEEHGLWLSALHAIPEKKIDPEDVACCIINYILKNNSDVFFETYKFETTDVDLVGCLNHIAKIRGCIKKGNEFDYDRVYKIVINDFRSGNLGRISFGSPPN